MSLTLKIMSLKLTFIILCFSYTTTIFSLLLFTNFITTYNLIYDTIICSTTKNLFIDGLLLKVFLHSMIGLILFEFYLNRNKEQSVFISSTASEISMVVEGELNPSIYSPLVDDLQKKEREYLIAKLQMIWDEIGEPNTNRDRIILKLEKKQCLEAYRRRIDQATKTKEKLHKKIVDVIAQLASIRSAIEDSEIHTDHSNGYPKNLKEYLMMITARLERKRREVHERRPTETPVILNIYDLTTTNRLFYWAGLGAFHSGVEVYGVEYSFGATNYPSCGVFKVEPRKSPNYIFRKSVVVGTTSYDPLQLSLFMDSISRNYRGDSYNLFTKNCNHFSKDVCLRLTGKPIPKWINRLAKLGSRCCCI